MLLAQHFLPRSHGVCPGAVGLHPGHCGEVSGDLGAGMGRHLWNVEGRADALMELLSCAHVCEAAGGALGESGAHAGRPLSMSILWGWGAGCVHSPLGPWRRVSGITCASGFLMCRAVGSSECRILGSWQEMESCFLMSK